MTYIDKYIKDTNGISIVYELVGGDTVMGTLLRLMRCTRSDHDDLKKVAVLSLYSA